MSQNRINSKHHRKSPVQFLFTCCLVFFKVLLFNVIFQAEDEEAVGAVGGQDGVRVCRVLEQKETMNGLQDDECGAPCEDGHEGLCL